MLSDRCGKEEMDLPENYLDELVANALKEDIGSGDLTTLLTVPEDCRAAGIFVAKEDFVLAGLEVARRAFLQLDPCAAWSARAKDGDSVRRGDEFAEVRAEARAILSAERVALNFLQRLSAIATLTRRFVERARGGKAVIVDTRKTTPGLRLLEKYAVRVGGGSNHRFGLYDGILIKDNHLALGGELKTLVARAKAGAPLLTKVEVEIEGLSQLEDAIEAGADIVLLDNMSPSQIREAAAKARGRVKLEASGGVRLENVAEYAAAGVDFISVGALTHSAGSVDISLRTVRL